MQLRFITGRDRQALVALAVLFIIMLVGSWQRWTQLISDHGREMSVPARILAGEHLYSDILYYYGPFAPHFNAWLYRLFGIHLSVLHASGIICAALILLMIYYLARQLMDEAEAALTTGLVLVICALSYSASYIQPYAYAALYAEVFAVGALVCVVSWQINHRQQLLWWAGVCAGLTAICKPEISALAVSAAGTALLIEAPGARRLPWREALFFALPLCATGGLTYGLLLHHVGWRTLVTENLALLGSPQLNYFSRKLSGLADWPGSIAAGIGALGGFLLLCGLCGLVAAALVRNELLWRNRAGRAITVALAGLLVWALMTGLFRTRKDASPFLAAPLILLAVTAIIVWRWKQSSERAEPLAVRQGLVLVMTAFAFASILRVLLNVTTKSPYTPFTLPVVIIVFLEVFFHLAPGLIVTEEIVRIKAGRVAMIIITIAIVATGATSIRRWRSNYTFAVSTPRGSLSTTPAIGRPLAEAISYAQNHTSPEDELLALPQGTGINFLAARSYPLRIESIVPGFLTGEQEAETIRRIAERRIPLVLVFNNPTPEYHDAVFGTDYNQAMYRFISDHYRLRKIFSNKPGQELKHGDREFFIEAFELKREGK